MFVQYQNDYSTGTIYELPVCNSVKWSTWDIDKIIHEIPCGESTTVYSVFLPFGLFTHTCICKLLW